MITSRILKKLGEAGSSGAVDASRPESDAVHREVTALLTSLKGLCLVTMSPTLDAMISPLAIRYECVEVEDHVGEGIALKLDVNYSAKPGAQGSHPMCRDARKALGITGPCNVHNNPDTIAPEPEAAHPENALVRAEVTSLLLLLRGMCAGGTLKALFPKLSMGYQCHEISGPEHLAMGLVVQYHAKKGAGVQHAMCVQARHSLGVEGKCGGT